MAEIVVGVDPAVTAKRNSIDWDCGGLQRPGQALVIDDRSGVMSPEAWARTKIDCYHEYEADSIAGESGW